MKTELINVISQTNRSTVSLVFVPELDKMAILKERKNADLDLFLRVFHQREEEDLTFLPKIYEYQSEDDSLTLLEEYIDGVTLSHLLEQVKTGQKETLTEAELSCLLLKTVRILRKLHSLNPPIIYRDLKPDNLILTKENELMILDFDAAREYKEDIESDTVHLGTRKYAAPEQYGFQQTDERADIYSFGILMKELLEVSKVSDSYSTNAGQILQRATMFSPKERYQNTIELENDLMKLNDYKWRKKHYRIAIAACAGLFIIGGAAGFGIGRLTAPKAGPVASNKENSESSGDIQNGVQAPDFVRTYQEVLTMEHDSAEIEAEQIYAEGGDGYYRFIGYPDEVDPVVSFLLDKYEGTSVTEVNEYAFCERRTLKVVVIPEGYRSIGQYAFYECVNLESIVIPQSVTEIDPEAFHSHEKATIYGHKGSYAETYAKAKGIYFYAIDEE